LPFDEQIATVGQDLKDHFWHTDARVICNSFGAYLFLHAQTQLPSFPGRVLLLSTIVGEFTNVEARTSFSPPRPTRLKVPACAARNIGAWSTTRHSRHDRHLRRALPPRCTTRLKPTRSKACAQKTARHQRTQPARAPATTARTEDISHPPDRAQATTAYPHAAFGTRRAGRGRTVAAARARRQAPRVGPQPRTSHPKLASVVVLGRFSAPTQPAQPSRSISPKTKRWSISRVPGSVRAVGMRTGYARYCSSSVATEPPGPPPESARDSNRT
jgi:hypothetical protein